MYAAVAVTKKNKVLKTDPSTHSVSKKSRKEHAGLYHGVRFWGTKSLKKKVPRGVGRPAQKGERKDITAKHIDYQAPPTAEDCNMEVRFWGTKSFTKNAGGYRSAHKGGGKMHHYEKCLTTRH